MIALRADIVVIAGLSLVMAVGVMLLFRVPPDPRCFRIGDVTLLVPDDAQVIIPETAGALPRDGRCAPPRQIAEVILRLRPAVPDLPDWVEDQALVTLRADHERRQGRWQPLAALCHDPSPAAMRGLQVRREVLSPSHVTDHIMLPDLPGQGRCTDLDLSDWPGPQRTDRMACWIEVALTENVTALFRLNSPTGHFGMSDAGPDHSALAETVAVATASLRAMLRQPEGDEAAPQRYELCLGAGN